MNYIDCHSHLLPGVDDGSQSMEESLRNLCDLRLQGVTKAIITPHVNSDYIRDHWIETPIPNNELRRVFDALRRKCGEAPERYPSLVLGSEFYYDPRKGGPIDPIPMGESGYVLLELPYESNLDNVKTAVEAIRSRGFKVMLAHPEKYDAFKIDWLNSLFWLRDNPEVKVQIEVWDTAQGNSCTWCFIETRSAHVLGTDSHGDHRPPAYAKAVDALLRWAGDDPDRQAYVRRLTEENARELFGL